MSNGVSAVAVCVKGVPWDAANLQEMGRALHLSAEVQQQH